METKLPENAMRPLKPGEEYKPLIPAKANPKEVTVWSLVIGLAMAVIFSAATAYLGLKVGQVFEAAIPITIIAVGLANAFKRKDTLGENVMIQSIGACSGMIVAGAIFTLPALYILDSKFPDANISVSFIEVFLASLLGGVIGILFLIPFRKYFVKEMHGKYPFPEATASTQVLISSEGEGENSSAKPLIIASVIGGLFDFCVATFGTWAENFTSAFCSWGSALAAKGKFFLSINTSAALLGMGYIVGLKYAAIMCAGSVLIWWIVVPIIGLLLPDLAINGDLLAGEASPQQIFQYAKSIGIGGIAVAGMIGVWNSRKVIMSSFSLIKAAFGKKNGETAETTERTDRDLSMKVIVMGLAIALLVTTLFFYLDVMHGSVLFTAVALLIVFIIAFLFTTVAANAIAIVGSNPVSGMTLMTLILASLVMATIGLSGTSGMVAALIMGGVVCTALSSAGAFITDLKIGYWVGSTPAKQQAFKFLGVLISAATAAGVIMILNEAYGFTESNSDVMAAPQARAMAGVIEPLMNGGMSTETWILYGIGALISLIMNACGISALAFALGMFIPLHLNLPLIIGGAVNHYVTTRSKDEKVNAARGERGTLLSSGFIAGGALMGVVSAALTFLGVDWMIAGGEWMTSTWGQLLSLVAYIGLIVYVVKASMKAK